MKMKLDRWQQSAKLFRLIPRTHNGPVSCRSVERIVVEQTLKFDGIKAGDLDIKEDAESREKITAALVLEEGDDGERRNKEGEMPNEDGDHFQS